MRKEPRMEAWSHPTWQDEGDGSTRETEKEQARREEQTREHGITEAIGRQFIHSFTKIYQGSSMPACSRYWDYSSKCKIPWLHVGYILGEKYLVRWGPKINVPGCSDMKVSGDCYKNGFIWKPDWGWLRNERNKWIGEVKIALAFWR